MHADSFFAIGSTHKINQDYAWGGMPNTHWSEYSMSAPRAIAIVSDGCSSSKDTDFGSRLLAQSAKDNQPNSYFNDRTNKNLINQNKYSI